MTTDPHAPARHFLRLLLGLLAVLAGLIFWRGEGPLSAEETRDRCLRVFGAQHSEYAGPGYTVDASPYRPALSRWYRARLHVLDPNGEVVATAHCEFLISRTEGQQAVITRLDRGD